jgi:hypothetical protein
VSTALPTIVGEQRPQPVLGGHRVPGDLDRVDAVVGKIPTHTVAAHLSIAIVVFLVAPALAGLSQVWQPIATCGLQGRRWRAVGPDLRHHRGSDPPVIVVPGYFGAVFGLSSVAGRCSAVFVAACRGGGSSHQFADWRHRAFVISGVLHLRH